MSHEGRCSQRREGGRGKGRSNESGKKRVKGDERRVVGAKKRGGTKRREGTGKEG